MTRGIQKLPLGELFCVWYNDRVKGGGRLDRQEEETLLLRTARLASALVLEYGGETFRAEETALRICRHFGMPEIDVFAVPTGLFLSVGDESGRHQTVVRRVRRRSIDLSRLDAINAISRSIEAGERTLPKAYRDLREVADRPSKPQWQLCLAAALSSGFFAVMFGGRALEFAVAALCGVLVQAVGGLTRRADAHQVLLSLLGSMAIVLVALGFVGLTGYGNAEAMIAGAIMPLLPGLAMTNAIRDAVQGDLLSGVTRAAEALLTAASLAAGAGLMLLAFRALGWR